MARKEVSRTRTKLLFETLIYVGKLVFSQTFFLDIFFFTHTKIILLDRIDLQSVNIFFLSKRMHTLVNFSREPSTSSVEPFLMCVSQELGLIVYSSRRSYWRKIKKKL